MKLPQIPEELLEFYPAMSAQNHETHINKYARKVAIKARSQAFEEIEKLRKALGVALQLADIASDWNLDEVEIDGVMVSIYDVKDIFSQAIRQHSQKGEDVNDR